MTTRSDESDLFGALAAASLEEPRIFARSVLPLIADRWGLLAASLFLYAPETRTLRLKAYAGPPGNAAVQVVLPRAHFVARAIASREPIIASRAEELARLHPTGRPPGPGVVAIPIGITLPAGSGGIVPPDPLAVLCVYPGAAQDLPVLAALGAEYGPFLARLYVATLERHAMNFRRETVREVAFSPDAASLARSFVGMAKQELNIEDCALWLLDSRRNQLYLKHGTSQARGGVPPLSIGRQEGEGDPVLTCFDTGTTLVHAKGHELYLEGSFDYPLTTKLANAALVPILLPPHAKLHGRSLPAAGVLCAYNHFTEHDGKRYFTDFTWEETWLAEFACEMGAVMVYHLLRTRDYESDFERRMHGARTNLQAARTRLQFLDHNEVGRLLPGRQRHFIPNAIQWIEDMEAQINRDELLTTETLELEDVSLYGTVLAKLLVMANGMAERYGVPVVRIGGLKKLAVTYRELPKVKGNRMALDCVFRNLVENCIKYADPEQEGGPRFEVNARSEGRVVVVRIDDNGIGIAADERTRVFEDGYRGATARARRPQGLGRGLYECRTLLELMDAKIAVRDSRYGRGTGFEVQLEHFRRRGSQT